METLHQVSMPAASHIESMTAELKSLIKTSSEGRWQLPKGRIDPGETAEIAALREVREEAGIFCEIVEPLDVIDYWFVGAFDGPKKRYHKKVHFFLMRFLDGDVNDHDDEVIEARWVSIGEAEKILAFDSEKDLIVKANGRLEASK